MDRNREHMENFLKEYNEHVLKDVPNLTSIPTPSEFKRHVDLSRPFVLRRPDSIVKESTDLWKDDSYLNKKMPFKMATVSRRPLEATKDLLILQEMESPEVPESIELVYPDTERNFLVPQAKERIFLPFNESICFRSFLKKLQGSEKTNGYIFIEKRNNLVEEFSPLLSDVSSDVPWATEALKKRPDAANINIGNSDVTTPPHKNDFEMIYYVITGLKEFIIYPPVSTFWMPYMKYKKFQWEADFFDIRWKLIDLKEEVIGIEPSLKPTIREKYIMMMHTKFFHITLNAGEGIYIPSQWIYQTRQSDRHIGLDYWYDLCSSKMFEFPKLKKLLKKVYFPPKE